RTMLHTARNNQEFAFVQRHAAIAKLHAETAAQHQEQLILRRVIVPDELALKFHHLHVLAIQFTHHAWIPMIGEQGQLFPDIDLFHVMRLSKLSQTAVERRYPVVNAPGEPTATSGRTKPISTWSRYFAPATGVRVGTPLYRSPTTGKSAVR